MAITPWLHYADHPLAPTCRSPRGSNMPVGDTSILTDGTTLYDPLDRPYLSNKRMLASGTYDRNEVRYDNLGRIVKQAAPCTWAGLTSVCPYMTTMAYDVLNRVTGVSQQMTNSTLQTTGYQYAGDTTTITDPQDNPKTLIKDPNGWLRETKDAYAYYINFGYDAYGSLTGVTDKLGHTLSTATYDYGLQPFRRTFVDIDSGSRSSTYDALGEITAWSDSKGQAFSAGYDALSRMTDRYEPDLYSHWVFGTSASAHNIGQLVSTCTGTGVNPSNCTTAPGYSESKTYDSKARLYQRTIQIPSDATYTYTWQYDANTGLLDTLTYPASVLGYTLQLKYGYANGILATITDTADSPNVTLWTANAQNPNGQITQESLGNGTVVNHGFDAVTGLVSSIQAGNGGGAGLQNQSYLFDSVGNLQQRQDNNAGLTENFYYDNLYRLDHSTLTNASGTSTNLQMGYDATGNVTTKSDVSASAWAYDSTHIHQVRTAGTNSYGYDSNGNMISRNGSPVTWSSYNYPVSVVSGSYSGTFSYNQDRQRYQQVVTDSSNTETTYFVGGLLEKTSCCSGSVMWRHYVYAGSQPVAIIGRGGNGTNWRMYLLRDALGSVSSVVNGTSAFVNESFAPFGYERNAADWSTALPSGDAANIRYVSRHGFTFQTTIGQPGSTNALGLVHMNGRVDDPITGRFLSADPHVPDPTNTQSYNRYSYAFNNPLTFTDPTGFDTVYQFREDWIWGFASFGQETQCNGSCGVYPGTETYSLQYGSAGGAGGRAISSSSAATSQANTDNSSSGGSASGAEPNPSPQGNLSQGDQPTSEVDINAPHYIIPDQNHLPADLTGIFPCGGFQCSYQMGQVVGADRRGVWLNVNIRGSASNGRWVQTYINSSTVQFTTDCLGSSSCIFYPSYASTGDWFFDAPNTSAASDQTWIAQASLLRPQGGAAFTFMWGYILLGNGPATYIPPVVVSPWDSQQQLIRRAQ